MVQEEVLGLMYAVGALLSFSFSPILYKVGLKNELHVLEANTLRAWGAFLLLTPIYVLHGFTHIIPLELIVFLVISAISGPIVGDTFFLFSIRKVGASIATPLANTYSLIVVVLSVILFSEKITLLNTLGGALILSSIWLVYLERRSIKGDVVPGLFAGLGAASGYALSIISMNVLLNSKIDPVTIIYFRIILVGILLTLIVRTLNFSFRTVSRRTLLALSVGGFFGVGFGVILLLTAITYLGAGKASLIASAAPVITSTIAMALLKEKFRAKVIIAAILVSIGAIMLK
ncbi:MAG: hypothetical protein DRO23_01700 [Thermoprotei archaeon]|nr:MAG: hypothetical protein DRO23_01700 [Thermoprotei archaeon]